jgi:hypothetical protein
MYVEAAGAAGSPLSVTTSGADIVVTAWIGDRRETRAGPITYPASAATVFRVSPLGEVRCETVVPPAPSDPAPARSTCG